MANPYVSLMSTAWRYARKEKKKYVLVYALFVVASIVSAMNPLLYGWFINAVQKEGIGRMHYAWWFAGGFLLLKLAEWSFHGPARIMERQLAFQPQQKLFAGIIPPDPAPARKMAPGSPQWRHHQPHTKSV